MIWLGLRFYQFVTYIRVGVGHTIIPRPDGVDGFLPISGLLGTASLFRGGGVNLVHPAAVVMFLTVLGVAFLLRRSFCSWICPVAALSESAWKSGYKIFKRNLRLPVWLDISLRFTKYLLMAFFVYSIAIAMSPDAMTAFISSDYHKTADIRMLDFFLQISPLALGVLLFLLAASIVLRNPFCRYLCPYGALLGLIAMLSPMRVTRNIDRCVECGVCSQVCPTYIDVMHKKSVASPECIGCWRCISNCRFNDALSMRAVVKFNVPGILFALLLLLLFLGGSEIGKWSGYWHTAISLEEYTRLLGK